MNYYNEFDPNAAAWLRELINNKLIPAGDVDTRSIKDVTANDLRGYTQCHFFAGIGGWSYALQLAGWPADRPVWTGSCPCQCYSVAGKQLGVKDERDLWPVFYELIRECRPEYVFGEQVENAIKHGWLDRVYANLEAENYTCRAVVLGAHSINAPHQRQRLYWGGARLANSESKRGCGRRQNRNQEFRRSSMYGGVDDSSSNRLRGRNQGITTEQQLSIQAQGLGDGVGMADMPDDGLNGCCQESGRTESCGESRGMLKSQREGNNGGLADGDGERCNGQSVSNEQGACMPEVAGSGKYCPFCDEWYPATSWEWSDGQCPDCGLSNSVKQGLQGCREFRNKSLPEGWTGEERHIAAAGLQSLSPWSDSGFILCTDGKVRRVPAESLFLGVADGVSESMDGCGVVCISEDGGFPLTTKKKGRSPLLKGYGNAIVPELAAEFITAFMEEIK